MSKKQKRPSLLDSMEGGVGQGTPAARADVVSITPKQSVVPHKSEIVKSTIYLPHQVHRTLQEIALATSTPGAKVKVHDLIMEGISRVLADRGYLSVDELKEK